MSREYTVGEHYAVAGGDGVAYCSADTPAELVKRLYGALASEQRAEGVMRAILALDLSAISSIGIVVRGADTWHVLVRGTAEVVVRHNGEDSSIHAPGVLTWSEVTVDAADGFQLGAVTSEFIADEGLPFEGGVVRASVLRATVAATDPWLEAESDEDAADELGESDESDEDDELDEGGESDEDGDEPSREPSEEADAPSSETDTVWVPDGNARSSDAERPSEDDVKPVKDARIVLSNGRIVELDRPVLLGRAPRASARPELQRPRLVTLPRASADVSRTHLLVEIDKGLVSATDLGSRNGTLITRPGSEPVRLGNGERMLLERGTRVELGDGAHATLESGR